MKITFAKTPKPKRFNYKPMYYDEKKEQQELRKKMREGKLPQGELLKQQIQKRWKRKDRSKVASQRSMLIFIVVLLILLYYVFVKS